MLEIVIIRKQALFRNSDLEVELVITFYINNKEAAFYRMLMEVNGNQPLFS